MISLGLHSHDIISNQPPTSETGLGLCGQISALPMFTRFSAELNAISLTPHIYAVKTNFRSIEYFVQSRATMMRRIPSSSITWYVRPFRPIQKFRNAEPTLFRRRREKYYGTLAGPIDDKINLPLRESSVRESHHPLDRLLRPIRPLPRQFLCQSHQFHQPSVWPCKIAPLDFASAAQSFSSIRRIPNGDRSQKNPFSENVLTDTIDKYSSRLFNPFPLAKKTPSPIGMGGTKNWKADILLHTIVFEYIQINKRYNRT